jgi:hypothetical protein
MCFWCALGMCSDTVVWPPRWKLRTCEVLPRLTGHRRASWRSFADRRAGGAHPCAVLAAPGLAALKGNSGPRWIGPGPFPLSLLRDRTGLGRLTPKRAMSDPRGRVLGRGGLMDKGLRSSQSDRLYQVALRGGRSAFTKQNASSSIALAAEGKRW